MKQANLANAEFAIMELLWEHGQLTARAIKEQLYPDTDKAQHGTVQRLLQRLEDKGFVTRDRSLSVHLYSPTMSRPTYASNQLESLTRRLTNGSLAPLITHLIEENRISKEELQRLRTILDDSSRDESALDVSTLENKKVEGGADD